MEQNRFKSPVVWGTVLAQVLAILVALEVITPHHSELVNNVIVAVLQVFVAFGLLNDPTHADRF